MDHNAERVQADRRDGTLAEYTLMSTAAVTPAEGLSRIDSAHLVVLMHYIVPFGGLLRGRLAVGETLVVICATGRLWWPKFRPNDLTLDLPASLSQILLLQILWGSILHGFEHI
jgi:hypothetical protein